MFYTVKVHFNLNLNLMVSLMIKLKKALLLKPNKTEN